MQHLLPKMCIRDRNYLCLVIKYYGGQVIFRTGFHKNQKKRARENLYFSCSKNVIFVWAISRCGEGEMPSADGKERPAATAEVVTSRTLRGISYARHGGDASACGPGRVPPAGGRIRPAATAGAPIRRGVSFATARKKPKRRR